MNHELIRKKSSWVAEINRLSSLNVPYFFMIDFYGEKGIVLPQVDMEDSGIFCNMDSEVMPESNLENYSFDIQCTDYEEYERCFHQVMQEIKNGNTYLINLCSRSPVQTDLTLKEIYRNSRSRFKVLVQDEIVVFSPESFVRIDEEGMIHTFPMKGTRMVGSTEENLRENKKEMAEHYTVVDLLRNDIGMVCDSVDVERFAYIDVLKTNRGEVEQMSSHIKGQVKKEFLEKPGNLLEILLPAGSISGAPKEKTLEIINETEVHDRGFYTGIFGLGKGAKMQTAVSIRFIKKEQNGQCFYYSGGGITASSKLDDEYNELCKKIYLPIF